MSKSATKNNETHKSKTMENSINENMKYIWLCHSANGSYKIFVKVENSFSGHGRGSHDSLFKKIQEFLFVYIQKNYFPISKILSSTFPYTLTI